MRITAIILSISLLIGFDMGLKELFSGVFQQKVLDCFLPTSECLYQYIPLFGEYLGIQLSYNTGIAFSIPIRWLPLQVITILLIIAIVYQYIFDEYQKKSKLLDIWYVFILAWALSHAYERIFIGYVVDFIAVKYFAILNFADILISIGAMCVIFYYIYPLLYGKK